jgi:trk system potassium uptake protein TrkA
VAESLVKNGHDVLGIDHNAATVQAWSDRLTHVVQADTTSIETLRRLGVAEFPHVVIGIGTDIESSVLTVLAVSELGVPDIWAKALGTNHGRILQRTGAHHVVYPEADMGERTAHLVTGKMLDFIEIDEDFAIVKTAAPELLIGRTLGEAGVRAEFGVTIIGLKKPGSTFGYATRETVVSRGDVLLASGPIALVEAFAAAGTTK